MLIPARREKYVLASMTTSAIINVIFNLLFIPYLSENAAAISTVLAEFCMMVMNYYYSRDIVRKVLLSKSVFNNFITSVIGGIGIVVVCLLCNQLISSLVLNTILSIVLSVLVYLFILLILRNEIVIGYSKKILQKMESSIK